MLPVSLMSACIAPVGPAMTVETMKATIALPGQILCGYHVNGTGIFTSSTLDAEFPIEFNLCNSEAAKHTNEGIQNSHFC